MLKICLNRWPSNPRLPRNCGWTDMKRIIWRPINERLFPRVTVSRVSQIATAFAVVSQVSPVQISSDCSA